MERAIRSRDYALTKLGEWYSERFARAYTPEIAGLLEQACILAIQDDQPIAPEAQDRVTAKARDLCSPERQVKNTAGHFLRVYSKLESIPDESWAQEEMFSQIPQHLRKKYQCSATQARQTLLTLVDAVRTRAEEIFPSDPAEEDINPIFLEVFDSVEKLHEFYDRVSDTEVLLCDQMTARGEMPPESFPLMRKYISAAKVAIRRLNQNIYEEISRS